MKKIDENLSQIFDIEPIEKKIVTDIVPMPEKESDQDLESDFNFARSNIKHLLRRGDVAIDNLLRVADESEHPRAYEVAANFIKTVADLNKDLLDIRKKKNELSGKTTVENNTTKIDKAVFVGSTTDLIKMIKDKREE
jgi:hypothetical protein